MLQSKEKEDFDVFSLLKTNLESTLVDSRLVVIRYVEVNI